jgi:hypothetical protein
MALGLAALVFVAHAAADAEPRVALVIGKSDYGGDLAPLPNPVNDGADFERAVALDPNRLCKTGLRQIAEMAFFLREARWVIFA